MYIFTPINFICIFNTLQYTIYMKKNILIITQFVVVLLSNSVLAQQTLINEAYPQEYKQAQLAFYEKNYVRAQQFYTTFLQNNNTGIHTFNPTIELLIQDAEINNALCSNYLGLPNAELLLTNFINNYNASPHLNTAYFQLAEIYFNQKNYTAAIDLYSKVDPQLLSETQLFEYQFKTAYSLFLAKKFEEAQKAFSKICNNPRSPYYAHANYYDGIISYYNKQYNNALYSFLKIEKDNIYATYMPYHIALMYYLQKNYVQLLSYATPKLQQKDVKNKPELNQLIGNALYNQNKYKDALPYLEAYQKTGGARLRKEEFYQLGVIYYTHQKYTEAAHFFTELSNANDTLGQNALYHLADCYLKLDDKTRARNTFSTLLKSNFNPKIKEIAAFTYPKLCYELGYQSEAITNFQSFITTYPNSPYALEAKTHLSRLFETTNNYTAAIEVLETIPNKNNALLETQQRVYYFRAVQVMNNNKFDEALTLLQKSLQSPIEKKITTLAYFWTADILFRQKNYQAAFKPASQFLALSDGQTYSAKEQPATANYLMGYVLLKQQQYADALPYFNATVSELAHAQSPNNTLISQIYNDAILRSGDCSFMQKDYETATKQYNKVLKNKQQGADYALYQQGILAGLLGNLEQKIEILAQVTTQYPNSPYSDDALYQIAITHVALQQYDQAITTHKKLINQQTESEYTPKSLVNLGLIYYNTSDYEKALQFYDLVLTRFPNSIQAQEALIGIKDVFIAKGDAGGYVAYLKKYPNLNVTTSEQDELTYQIAENYYNKADCHNAQKAFSSYLKDYPNGAFKLEARYYRAQCLYNEKKYTEAAADYQYVADQPRNLFTEQALDKTARVALYITKDYNKAYLYFRKLYETANQKELTLEALRGLLQATFYLKKADELNQYATLLAQNPNATPNDLIDTYHYKALLAYQSQNYTAAFPLFQEVARQTTNEKGAAARYYIAQIYFKNNNFEECRKACNRTNQETPEQEYWVARSFLLIADMYLAKNETFQAKATLNSILENYTNNDDARQEALEKYNKILKEEEKNGN